MYPHSTNAIVVVYIGLLLSFLTSTNILTLLIIYSIFKLMNLYLNEFYWTLGFIIIYNLPFN